MKVQIDKLEIVLYKILDHVKKNHGNSIEIEYDYFWNIPKEERYDPYNEPKRLDIGQLSDNLQEIAKIADGSNEPIAFGLVWISNILRFIGEEKVS